MRCACLGPRHSPYANYTRTPGIAAVETIFNVLSYDAVLRDNFIFNSTVFYLSYTLMAKMLGSALVLGPSTVTI